MPNIVIAGAPPSASRAASAVLARAFFDDPQMTWLLPDDASRPKRLQLMFATMHRHYYGRSGASAMAAAPDGGVAAVALWARPGEAVPPMSRQLLATPGMVRSLRDRMGPAQAAYTYLGRRHPKQPHWYLAALGTLPELQGQGFGSALLRPRLAECDRSRELAYLESSKASNIPFYEHHGFTVTEELVPPDGVPCWGMVRSPRR